MLRRIVATVLTLSDLHHTPARSDIEETTLRDVGPRHPRGEHVICPACISRYYTTRVVVPLCGGTPWGVRRLQILPPITGSTQAYSRGGFHWRSKGVEQEPKPHLVRAGLSNSTNTDSQRQYIDLIFRASNKYGSWDPEITIEPGDYGRITQGRVSWFAWWKRRGIFLKEGNIFKNKIAEEFDIPEPVQHDSEAVEGVTWVTSKNTEQIDISADVSGKIPGFASCKVKAAFQFTSGAGAILTMQDETITTIDPPGSLRRLLDDEKMRGFVIVSEVHRCSSYVRYLSSPTTKNIAIGLSAESPTPGAPGASVDAKWVRSTATGNFKSKVGKEGRRDYYPLFRLVSVKETNTSTGMRGDENEMPPLQDAQPPWLAAEGDEPTSDSEGSGTGKASRRNTLRLPFISHKQ